MRILAFLVVGIISGWLAGELIEGDGFGLLGNLALGVVGAMVGGFILDIFGETDEPNSFIGALITSTLGAVLTLAILNVLF